MMDAHEFRARLLANKIADLELANSLLMTENQILRQEAEERKTDGPEAEEGRLQS